jgi:hypothetical protein
MDFKNETAELFLGGESQGSVSIDDPGAGRKRVLRLGHFYYDDKPMIGKIVGIHAWDRSGSLQL